MDIDKWIETVKQCQCLPEDAMRQLCILVTSHLIEESNVQPVRAPVTVCGDIHGQFHDLLALFETGGELPHTNYIFMGDYVDRGLFSVETLTYLLLLKAKYPDNITLLRGNHETRQITQIYGFYDECQKKYGTSNVWRYCVEVFDCLNIAAVIDGKVLCVHGGLSPEVNTIDQIRTISRRKEIPHDGAFCDLVWSDPDQIDKWMRSPRGAGYLFGSKVTEHFSEINGLNLICRAHQLVMEGFQEHFNFKLYTVWSAPNYCYRCGNKASVMAFDDNLEYEFKLFNDVPPPEKERQKQKTLYFV